MKSRLHNIEKSFYSALTQAKNIEDVSKIRVAFLGKKGELTIMLHSIGDLPSSERPLAGKLINDLSKKLEDFLNEKQATLQVQQEQNVLEAQGFDIGLPGRGKMIGNAHPLTLVEEEIVNVFRTLGFSVVDGPEIETDFYNFESLNFPLDHPARDMQDTFFVENNLLLRTHTSPVQVRTMQKCKPPIRIVVPGRVYRHDSDVTHSPVFHQVEGLCVGKDITFSHLKGTIQAFVHMIFGEHVETRFRPSFFPFTEPSAEVDVKGPHGWLEILGCGMVDPNVFGSVGESWKARGEANPYDAQEMSGFAFGLGIERIAMILYNIPDIRLFYNHDIRFLNQFVS